MADVSLLCVMVRFITGTEGIINPQDAGSQWLTLQRTVAVAMIVVLATPMVVVLQRLVPMLAAMGGLFAVSLGLTWIRPRTGAIGVGVLATVWLVLQLSNYSLVVTDLIRPSATLSFMISLGMVVVPTIGLIGLLGVLRHASGQFATRTLQAGGIVLLGGGLLSLLASFWPTSFLSRRMNSAVKCNLVV